MSIEIPVRVRDIRTEADRVVSLILEHARGDVLPAWGPGSHIDLVLRPGVTRQYSLSGDPADLSYYRIGVLEELDGSGGSRVVHHEVEVGDELAIRAPRNQFVLDDVRSYLFIAGGIGITPILPMLRKCEERNRSWRILYCGRSMASMAFREEVRERGEARALFLAEDEAGLPDIGAELGAAEPPDRIYVCGPPGLIEAVRTECRLRGLGMSVRYELFTPTLAGSGPDGPFDVVIGSTGQRIQVAPDQSVLEALRDAGFDRPSECEGGLCGTCETGLLAGDADHRDYLLSDEERAANKRMMICVSRAISADLTVDL